MHSMAQASTATPTRTTESTAAETARTWTFAHSVTGQPFTVTCMPGCTLDHAADTDTPTHPMDVYCWTQGDPDAVTLPIDTSGKPEDYRILNTFIEVNPFSPTIGRRLPHAVIEVIDEHYIEPLDPDCLETVINVLAGRLDEMRRVHAELVRVRAEHASRSGVTA